jgi:hypothetical protein
MKRLAIALAGLSTAVASGIAAVFLAYLAEDEARAWLLWVLTVASVAGPLYGAVAGVQNAAGGRSSSVSRSPSPHSPFSSP